MFPRSRRSICCREVFSPPARMRVLVSVNGASTATTRIPRSAKRWRTASPISSWPSTPTAVTSAPSARAFAAAFAAPPSVTSDDSCRTTSTGASRLTRSVCP